MAAKSALWTEAAALVGERERVEAGLEVEDAVLLPLYDLWTDEVCTDRRGV